MIDELHFDQLVSIQCLAHALDQVLNDTLFSYLHHWFQVMGQSSEVLSF
jgi:hypothetical protein